jgi:hypothetical protein
MRRSGRHRPRCGVRDLVHGVHDREAGAGVCIVESEVDPELDGPGRAYPHHFRPVLMRSDFMASPIVDWRLNRTGFAYPFY